MSTLLEVTDVRKSFGGLQALSGCSFTVERGSVTGLIGPNGSGKTTMFNVITGYERADSGIDPLRRPGHHRSRRRTGSAVSGSAAPSS